MAQAITRNFSETTRLTNFPATGNSILHLIQDAPTVHTHTSCKNTLRVMFSYPESPSIVVVDKRNHPVGLIVCNRFYLTICSRSGLDHYYHAPISTLMNHKPLIIDIQQSYLSIAQAINKRPPSMRNDSIIITDHDGLYAGVISPSDIPHYYKP